jgi:hypothetical protein
MRVNLVVGERPHREDRRVLHCGDLPASSLGGGHRRARDARQRPPSSLGPSRDPAAARHDRPGRVPGRGCVARTTCRRPGADNGAATAASSVRHLLVWHHPRLGEGKRCSGVHSQRCGVGLRPRRLAVPADQIERAAASVDGIPRLHRRIQSPCEPGGELVLSESEAILLLAVVRHRLLEPPRKLAAALLGTRGRPAPPRRDSARPEASAAVRVRGGVRATGCETAVARRVSQRARA